MNNKQGTYEYITLDYVLAGVKSRLGLRQTTIYDSYLMDAINQVLKRLRSFATENYIVTQLEIDHTSGTPKTKLPNGFIRFVKTMPIVYVNAQGKAVNGVNNGTVNLTTIDIGGNLVTEQVLPSMTASFAFSSPVFINNAFFMNSPYGDVNRVGDYGSVNLVDGWLYFSDNVIADYIKISYLGTNIDQETGQIKIPAYAEDALVSGACEMYCMTEYTVTGDQKYRALANDYKRDYAKYKAIAKVIPLMPDSNEYAFINQVMKSLI
jgi:hypothetical protein